MAGTIVTDRIESDASYASSINIASPMVVSNTLTMGSAAAITGNVNIDSGLLFVDAVNNRVGVNTQNPSSALDISGGVFVRGSTGTGTITNRIVIDYNGTSGVGTISANSTGGDTQLNFATSKSGTNATRMTINQDGHVTMSSQPALFAQPDVNGSFAAGFSTAIYGWNTSGGVRYNRGFTISAGTASLNRVANAASTGRITVPSSGIYALYFDMRNESQSNSGASIPYGSDSNGGQAGVFVNSTQIIRRHINPWANFPYNHVTLHAMLNLNANDYIEVGAWWNNSTVGTAFQGYGDTVNWLYLVKIA